MKKHSLALDTVVRDGSIMIRNNASLTCDACRKKNSVPSTMSSCSIVTLTHCLSPCEAPAGKITTVSNIA